MKWIYTCFCVVIKCLKLNELIVNEWNDCMRKFLSTDNPVSVPLEGWGPCVDFGAELVVWLCGPIGGLSVAFGVLFEGSIFRTCGRVGPLGCGPVAVGLSTFLAPSLDGTVNSFAFSQSMLYEARSCQQSKKVNMFRVMSLHREENNNLFQIPLQVNCTEFSQSLSQP